MFFQFFFQLGEPAFRDFTFKYGVLDLKQVFFADFEDLCNGFFPCRQCLCRTPILLAWFTAKEQSRNIPGFRPSAFQVAEVLAGSDTCRMSKCSEPCGRPWFPFACRTHDTLSESSLFLPIFSFENNQMLLIQSI